MQIEGIKITDYINKQEDTDFRGRKLGELDTGKPKVAEPLKTIKVESYFYNKQGLKSDEKESSLENIEKYQELGAETMREVENLSKNIDEDIVKCIEDDGYDIMDMDARTIVTVADKIKMALAKGGMDVSTMGGIDEDVIKEMTGSVAQALELSRGIENNLNDESIKYLVTNQLEPTILNIYNASYATPAEEYVSKDEMSDEELVDLLEGLADKLDKLIEEAEAGDKNLCSKMLQQNIPLTKGNLEYMARLQDFEKPTDDEILGAIDDIVAEGKEPEEAYLIQGYSLMDQAREKVAQVQSMNFEDLFDVQSKITLTEVQLSMTVEATFTMMKNGVEVNTQDLSDLLDKLKLQETSLLNMLLKTDENKDTSASVELFQETMKEMADIAASPVEMFGSFSNISQSTISEIHKVSVSFNASFTQMEATYDAVGTEVRKDLGDSINKAFNNIGDILEDLGLEADEENQGAVRALAYNKMNITSDSVLDVKASLELVNRTFKSMSPAVVVEMIRRGENPLDIKLEDLNNRANEIKAETGSTKDSESFAKFLWKAEQLGEISEEERESYIGVYRLMNQVEKTDGAAIGALIAQGSEITLRNLMTAVRSSKRSGREYEVSDRTGYIEQLNVQGLSITEQVEKAFMTNRCRDAKEAMSPAKLQELGEETYMEMNPDEFAKAMEEIDDEKTEALYNKNLAESLKEAIEAEKDVYQIIEELHLPTTANTISAVEAMIRDNNQAIRDLYGKAAEKTDLDIEYLIEELTERFGEACKTPEEMAEAQEALGILAERVMKTMIESEDVQKIDLDGMRLIISQTKVYNELARENETYNIPIMVADEAGNLNLKIVRGTTESGLVKMVLNMTSTGVISSTFRYEKGEVNATIDCETAQMREALASEAPIIAQTMQEETGFSFNISFGRDKGTSALDIYRNETGDFETTESRDDKIQTEALYGIARGFIKVVGEMFS